jgi:hypothetical protein
MTLLAGYSPRRRQVVVFAVEDAGGTSFWPLDVFPGVGDLTPGRLTRHAACDGGERVATKLRFDATRELWRGAANRRTHCAALHG